MPADTPRLRGGSGIHRGPWPTGQIPDEVIHRIASRLVYARALGRTDITGDDFGDYLAHGVDGMHRSSPLGVVDVVRNGCGWTAKTVKANRPHDATTVRLISGRNSPDYSLGISDPRKDVAATGRAVLSIWNQRVNESLDEHDELRLMVLVRHMEAQRFLLFEDEISRFPADNYRWQVNNRGNLEGMETATGRHCFTWQPHGSQFTVIRQVPGAAVRFTINRAVPQVSPEHVMRLVRYENDWIEIG